MSAGLTPPRPWPLDAAGKPKRRVAVAGNRGVYWRPDGTLEIGYRDADGRQRWRRVRGGITAARAQLRVAQAARDNGERESANPRLKFGEAADRWLAEQVAELRPATRAGYASYVKHHLAPRWDNRRMDAIDVTDVAQFVRELRAAGYAEWTITGIVRAANRVFKFARRHCHWRGENPLELLERRERPHPTTTPERRIYSADELAQMIAASREPWRTLFRLASVCAGRESELLGLWWEDLGLADQGAATIRFGHQVDHAGERVELKTEESKATLPLPRAAARLLLEHKAHTPAPTGPRSYVFATRTGRALGYRNVLRALYQAQQQARTPDGLPTFPELFEHDDRGRLVVDAAGQFLPATVKRRDLKRRGIGLPDFHALRHGAAMDCEDAEEARDLLRHKNSNVTRAVYRAHFGDRRRELLRTRMEARMEASDPDAASRAEPQPPAEVADLQARRGAA